MEAPIEHREIRIKFRSADGEEMGDEIMIDSRTSKVELNKILDQIMLPDEKQVYQFFVDESQEVRESIGKAMDRV